MPSSRLSGLGLAEGGEGEGVYKAIGGQESAVGASCDAFQRIARAAHGKVQQREKRGRANDSQSDEIADSAVFRSLFAPSHSN